MSEDITVHVEPEEPEVAVMLEELRYLVFEGKAGDSAYDIAVSLGFSGTKAEWIASLMGEAGPRGEPGQLYYELRDNGETLYIENLTRLENLDEEAF